MADPIFYMSVKNLLLADVLTFVVAVVVLAFVTAIAKDALRFDNVKQYVVITALFSVWSFVLFLMVTAFNGYVIYGFFTALQVTASFGNWILIAAFITMNLLHLLPAVKAVKSFSVIIDSLF